MMTPEQFENALDLYGSDLSIWPESMAEDAQDLLTQSEKARQTLEDAVLLDTTLDAYTVEEPSAAFEARLLDLAPKAHTASEAGAGNALKSWFSLRWASAAAASLACAAFGFAVGLQSVDSIQTRKDAEAFMTASISTYTDEFWTGEEG